MKVPGWFPSASKMYTNAHALRHAVSVVCLVSLWCMTIRALNFAVSLQLYKLNIHNVVAEFVPLIMNTIAIQVSAQAR